MSSKSKSEADEKKQTITEVVQEVLGDTLKDLAKGQKEATKQRKVLADQMKAMAEKLAADDEDEDEDEDDDDDEEAKAKAKAKADKEKEDKDNPMLAALKKLSDQIAGLKTDKTRKGAQDDDDNDDDDDNADQDDNATPKKALKSPTDPDTCKFVLHAMKRKSVWAKLDDSEKEEAKNIYFSIWVAKELVGEVEDDENDSE